MKKKFLIFLLIILLSTTTYASEELYINEISFLKPEFVEVYSVNSVNLSDKLFYDEYGIEKANKLNLINKKSSNIYLIVGDDFLEEYDISQINATIYKTQKSGLGYYGLKDSGENFTILINSTINLSWKKYEEYEFEINQTLNYNLTSNNYFISNSSPGKLFYKPSLLVNPNLNLTNESFQNITINITSNYTNCNFSFKIIPYKNLTFDKIEFEFQTNISNFQIEYWIETYLGNIVKSKRNTTNLDTKTYTPNSNTELYKIKANIYYQTCIRNDSKLITYYNKNPTILNSDKSSSSSSSSDNEKNQISKSHIIILNELDISNDKSNILKYEIYKGNTQKRTMYFYLNKEKITSFELEKYSKIKGQINLKELNNNNTLMIEGLDLKKELIFSRNYSQNILVDKTFQSNFPKLEILNITNSKIYFNFSNNDQNLSVICYVNNIRTKVSNIINLTSYNNSTHYLEINNSKFKDIEILGYDLKLYCKYKKIGLKTYNSLFENFTYLIQQDLNSKTLELNIFDTFNSNSIQYTSIQKNQDQSLISETIFEENNSIYLSETSNTKKSSIYYIFLALSLIVIGFIIAW